VAAFIVYNAGFERIKGYLNSPLTKKQAERLALEGRDFRTLWESFDRAAGEVDKAVKKARKRLESGGGDGQTEEVARE
jgi:hypothetical protein